MNFKGWYLLLGGLMLLIALGDPVVKRLPLTTTILYFLLGVLLGPLVLGLFAFDPIANSPLLERISELAVIISLFTTGLKLSPNLWQQRRIVPLMLAFVAMSITVGLIALVGAALLGLPLGAAILLGAVLAPTDPVLASDVQLKHPTDRDNLRFDLSGEAAMNDGTAFPFVMLGLGLLGLHELGPNGLRWALVDGAWAILGGLAIGAVCGTLIGKLVLRLRRRGRESLRRDEFIALGLIGVSYGAALLLQTYGFLAVFAAGLFVRKVEAEQPAQARITWLDRCWKATSNLSGCWKSAW